MTGPTDEARLCGEIARAFAQRLHRRLGAAVMAEIVARNDTPMYARACATHDYCDANLLMAAALRAVTGVRRVQGDREIARWNAAWDVARDHSFDMAKITARYDLPALPSPRATGATRAPSPSASADGPTPTP